MRAVTLTFGELMPRADMSQYLVHWTKGKNYDEAFDRLRQIVFGRTIKGSNNAIRGGWTCVCFTEAPAKTFHEMRGRYLPFGVQVPKSWLFKQGGRPVIYQTNDEYELLPEEMQWRHVRYEPSADPTVDFSWEREWRVSASELVIIGGVARILVPDQSWADALMAEHDISEEQYVQLLVSEYGDDYLQFPRRSFEFFVSVIDAWQIGDDEGC